VQPILTVPDRSSDTPRLSRRSIPEANDPLYRLNVVCPYFTMFPLSFPLRILRRAAAGDGVLDPFCGRGSTLFAARLLGLPTVGLDSNPLAAVITAAKLVDVPAQEITNLACLLLATSDDGDTVPTAQFWTRCYHPLTLIELNKLRSRLLENCTSQAAVALRAVLLGILHGPVNKGVPTYLSNQMPRTYATKPTSALSYWRKRRLKPARVDVLDAVRRRALYTFVSIPAAVPGKVLQADSRAFSLPPKQRLFRWVITSPPYHGMRSYFPDQWLRDWFLGGRQLSRTRRTSKYLTEARMALSPAWPRSGGGRWRSV
jgi:DNA methylase